MKKRVLRQVPLAFGVSRVRVGASKVSLMEVQQEQMTPKKMSSGLLMSQMEMAPQVKIFAHAELGAPQKLLAIKI